MNATLLRLLCILNGAILVQASGGEAQTSRSPLSFLTMTGAVQKVFSGAQKLSVTWRNRTGADLELKLHPRLHQVTSGVAVQVSDGPELKLKLLAGQTLLDERLLTFPEVRAKSRFLIQWISDAGLIVGSTSAEAYPSKLLAELTAVCRNKPLGILDPLDEIKPILRSQGIEFKDLEQSDLEEYSGTLAILGPYRTTEGIQGDLMKSVKSLCKRGVGVVWIRILPKEEGLILPPFGTIQKEGAVIVFAQPETVQKLAENPQSQLNLLRLCKLAVRSHGLDLDDLNPSE